MNMTFIIARVVAVNEDNILVKNQDKGYEIRIKCGEPMLSNIKEYVNAGDLMGIKGSLEHDGDFYINAEKVTFLSSRNK